MPWRIGSSSALLRPSRLIELWLPRALGPYRNEVLLLIQGGIELDCVMSFRTRCASCWLWFSCKSSLELRDQSRQGFRPFIRGEVTAGQPLNLEAEVAQSFLREIDLPVFKGIFVAAAHQERELIGIRLEKVTEVKP